MTQKLIKRDYHCPRCKTSDIIVYEDRVECRICDSEFLKCHFASLDDEDILSVQDILSFLAIFEEMFTALLLNEIKDNLLL